MFTRWYARRSGANASTDEDRAMAHQELGPFASRDEARRTLVGTFATGAWEALNAEPRSVTQMFGGQYVGLLLRVAAEPDAQSWSFEGAVWTLWEIPAVCVDHVVKDPAVPEVAVGKSGIEIVTEVDFRPGQHKVIEAAAPEPTRVTVTLNVSDLSERMRDALLNSHPDNRLDGNDLSGTRVALINRGLVEAGHGGRYLPLTEAGLRARDRLEELRDADAPVESQATEGDEPYRGEDYFGEPVDHENHAHAYAYGVLRAAAQMILERNNLSGYSAEQLRAALAHADATLVTSGYHAKG